MRPARADVEHAELPQEAAKMKRQHIRQRRTTQMTTPTVNQTAVDVHVFGEHSAQAEAYARAENDQADPFEFDPFEIDITFIENTPDADGILMCSTSDNCGTSCPSACTTSG